MKKWLFLMISLLLMLCCGCGAKKAPAEPEAPASERVLEPEAPASESVLETEAVTEKLRSYNDLWVQEENGLWRFLEFPEGFFDGIVEECKIEEEPSFDFSKKLEEGASLPRDWPMYSLSIEPIQTIEEDRTAAELILATEQEAGSWKNLQLTNILHSLEDNRWSFVYAYPMMPDGSMLLGGDWEVFLDGNTGEILGAFMGE